MGRLNRGVLLATLLAAAALGCAAVLGLLALEHSASEPTRPLVQPLVLRARLTQTTAGFGDELEARVVVLVDSARVRPGTLRLRERIAPLSLLAPIERSRRQRAGILMLTSRLRVACLSKACVPDGERKRLRLAEVQLEARSRSGRLLHLSASWPELEVRGRVLTADLRPPLHFRRVLAPPPPSYRIAPGTLTLALTVAAGLLAAAGLALVAWQALLLWRRRRARMRPLEGLAAALQALAEARARPAGDRRRALNELARLLEGHDRYLAHRAGELAWSRSEPEGEALEALLAAIERGLPAAGRSA